MLKLHYKIKNAILTVVDFFYPPFKKFLPVQTFRYAVCGGSNQLLNILLFSFFYHFVYHKDLAYLPFGLVLKPYVASFISAFCICFPTGFYLNKFVVFPGSYLRRRVQFFRYFTIVLVNIFLNYGILRLFVEFFHWYPTPAFIVDNVLVISFTYFSQRYFTFRQKPNGAFIDGFNEAKNEKIDAVAELQHEIPAGQEATSPSPSSGASPLPSVADLPDSK